MTKNNHDKIVAITYYSYILNNTSVFLYKCYCLSHGKWKRMKIKFQFKEHGINIIPGNKNI